MYSPVGFGSAKRLEEIMLETCRNTNSKVFRADPERYESKT
jgi:hypothetical protein